MTTKSKELIIGVMKDAAIEQFGLEDGLNPMPFSVFIDHMEKLIENGEIVCQERSAIEKNTDILQLLPYVTVTDSVKAFHHAGIKGRWLTETVGVYKRKDKVGEQRLVGKLSVGIGGHVEYSDYLTAKAEQQVKDAVPAPKLDDSIFDDPTMLDFTPNVFFDMLRVAVEREFDEELEGGFASIEDFDFIGLILDRSDEVGNVHLGLSYVASRPMNQYVFKMNEPELEVFDPAAVPYEIISDPDVYDRLENWSKIFLDFMADNFVLGKDMLEHSHLLNSPSVIIPDMSKELIAVPRMPRECQWGGLARDIIMAWDCQCDTPRKLFNFLNRSGIVIPQWLLDEAEMKNLDHVPSKGTRATIIYRAMVEDHLRSFDLNPDWTELKHD